MAKREREEVERDIRGQSERRGQEERDFIAGREGERNEARTNARAIREHLIVPRADEYSQTGGYDPSTLDRVRSRFGDAYGSGGFDPNETALTRDYIRGIGSNVADPEQQGFIRGASGIFTGTGGYDEGGLQDTRARYGELAVTGGFDDPTLKSIRSGYQNFSETGGITPQEKESILRRTTRGVSSLYEGLTDESKRRMAITGGSGAGELARIGRDASSAQAEALIDTQGKIAELERTGKLRGLEGMASTEAAVAGGRREATAGAARVESDLATQRQNALRGLADYESGVETRRQAGQVSQAQQLADLEASMASGRRDVAGREAGFEADVARGRREGVDALMRQYNMDQTQLENAGREILQRLSIGAQLTQAELQMLAALSSAPGLFDNIIRGVGAVAGAVDAWRTP